MYYLFFLLVSSFLLQILPQSLPQSPSEGAEALWQCLGGSSATCFYDLRSQEVRAACDASDSGCVQAFTLTRNIIFLTRGIDAFQPGMYDMRIQETNETHAVVHVYVPAYTQWPIKLFFVQEGGLWLNEYIQS